MIESDKTFGTFTIYCDEVGCDEHQEFDTDGDWDQFIEEAKEEGWTMRKIGGQWYHKCLTCNGAQECDDD